MSFFFCSEIEDVDTNKLRASQIACFFFKMFVLLFWLSFSAFLCTPRETNIAPENWWLEYDRFLLWPGPFLGAMLVLGRVSFWGFFLFWKSKRAALTLEISQKVPSPELRWVNFGICQFSCYFFTVGTYEFTIQINHENVGEYTLGGGFKYVLFSPLFREDFRFDWYIFQMGWNHQLEINHENVGEYTKLVPMDT